MQLDNWNGFSSVKYYALCAPYVFIETEIKKNKHKNDDYFVFVLILILFE